MTAKYCSCQNRHGQNLGSVLPAAKVEDGFLPPEVSGEMKQRFSLIASCSENGGVIA